MAEITGSHNTVEKATAGKAMVVKGLSSKGN
jgi:hypothetical protein